MRSNGHFLIIFPTEMSFALSEDLITLIRPEKGQSLIEQKKLKEMLLQPLKSISFSVLFLLKDDSF